MVAAQSSPEAVATVPGSRSLRGADLHFPQAPQQGCQQRLAAIGRIRRFALNFAYSADRTRERAAMLYNTPEAWLNAKHKSLFLFGMSGVGKTRVAAQLREYGSWYHYTVDYRIGTRYLDEQITDIVKQRAMEDPMLRDLLCSDSIVLRSKVTFANLTPLSAYLGKPGNPKRGGLEFREYRRRQALHEQAERRAMEDADVFIERARKVYGYGHFACDASGSVCELADPNDPKDPVFTKLSRTMLPVYIEASDSHRAELERRFAHRPKPMYFHPEFLDRTWKEFLGGKSEKTVDPDQFLVYAFGRLIDWRLPRYKALAKRWGVSVAASRLGKAKSDRDIIDLIGEAIARKSERKRS